MSTTLITGATSFLGYHVAKRLNQAGIRPRVLERPEGLLDVLGNLDVERCAGHLDDPAAVRMGCAGVDTLLHVAFKVNIAGGPEALEEMQRVNVDGTRSLLKSAAEAGVRRAVVTGSALAVGVNRQPIPLDETASWAQHAFNIPYANLRRQVELDALAQTTPRFGVVTVCPSFTFGPDDPSGAPANKLVRALIDGKVPCKVAVGFGCLDVRDFANGMVLAGERGRPGQRYLLSGENITADQLVDAVAAISGVRGPRFTAPAFIVKGLVSALGLLRNARGKQPPITNEVLQILGRSAWYNTTRARTELGWTSRSLHETLTDTIRWLRAQAAVAGAGSAQT